MEESAFQRLEQQIEQLLTRCQDLHQENRALRRREQEWKSERARLLQTHNSTEAKVEAMIQRLKAMEQE